MDGSLSPSPSRPFVVVQDPLSPPEGLAPAVVAIGNFDGVHRGHRAVIARAQALAAELGKPCAVLTFEPHPADVFAGRPAIFRLTPLPAKAVALARLGTVDGMITLTFDASFASMTAQQFIDDVLVRRLGIAAAVVGHDFHFGKGRTGSPALLTEAGLERGFAVATIDKIVADAAGDLAAVSSTATRKLLEAGNVAAAADLLGHPYFVLGTVIHGRKLGRTLGFPTANVALDPSSRLAHGIYAVRVSLQGAPYGGVASFGRRPTFDDGPPLLEVFLFDFDGDLYGRTLEIDFIGWIRGEQKFASAEALTARMNIDADLAQQILGPRRPR